MLYPEFREKFEVDEVVFTQRYVVGNQLFVCIFQKIIACLDFLSKLQEKYDVGRDWSSFYFHCFESRNKICVLLLSNSLRKKWRFKKKKVWFKSIFLSMDSNLCFHHLVEAQNVWYVVCFKRNNDKFNGDDEKKELTNYLTNIILHLKVENHLDTVLKKLPQGLILILNLLYIVKEASHLLLNQINFSRFYSKKNVSCFFKL